MKISIVIPTYKRANYLDDLLRSIQTQTFQDFEIIIVDDCSPNQDEYKKVIEKYNSKFKALTFLVNKQNLGACHSRNKGIKKAKYDLIALVDDDDRWLPKKLENQVNMFTQYPDTDIIYTWADAVDENGKIIDKYRAEIEGNPKSQILKNCFMPSSSIMVKKQSIVSIGMFDESMPSCQDWDMWTRMILNGAKVKVVKQINTIYQKHNNASIGSNPKLYKGYMIYFRKNFITAMKANPIIVIYYIYYIYHVIKIRWKKS